MEETNTQPMAAAPLLLGLAGAVALAGLLSDLDGIEEKRESHLSLVPPLPPTGLDGLDDDDGPPTPETVADVLHVLAMAQLEAEAAVREMRRRKCGAIHASAAIHRVEEMATTATQLVRELFAGDTTKVH
jgi:hypothetical protein